MNCRNVPKIFDLWRKLCNFRSYFQFRTRKLVWSNAWMAGMWLNCLSTDCSSQLLSIVDWLLFIIFACMFIRVTDNEVFAYTYTQTAFTSSSLFCQFLLFARNKWTVLFSSAHMFRCHIFCGHEKFLWEGVATKDKNFP